MNPFEAAKTFTSFWGQGQEAVVQAQTSMLRSAAQLWSPLQPEPITQEVPPAERQPDAEHQPEDEASEAAGKAFRHSWAAAREVASRQERLGLSGDASPEASSELAIPVLDPAAWLGRGSRQDTGLPEERSFDIDRLDRLHVAVRKAALALVRRTDEYEAGVLTAWTRAAAAFLDQASASRAPEQHPPDLAPRWKLAASRAVAELRASEQFLGRRQQVIEAAGELRSAQQEFGEVLSSVYGVPSRADMDEFYTDLDALRRELRGQSPGQAPAAAEGNILWQRDRVRLRRCRVLTEPSRNPSLLIIPDLFAAPGEKASEGSALEALSEHGFDVLLLDWGQPARADRLLTLDDYISVYLAGAVEAATRARPSGAPVHLAGIAGGGILALCQAALRPETSRSLTLLGTAVDFQSPEAAFEKRDLVWPWLHGLSASEIERVSDLADLLPPSLTARDVLPGGSGPVPAGRRGAPSRSEAPGRAYAQWLKQIVEENRLAEGALSVSGRRVDLAAVTCPVLNISRSSEGAVPRALSSLAGTQDYTERRVEWPAAPSDDPAPNLTPALAEWLEARSST